MYVCVCVCVCVHVYVCVCIYEEEEGFGNTICTIGRCLTQSRESFTRPQFHSVAKAVFIALKKDVVNL